MSRTPRPIAKVPLSTRSPELLERPDSADRVAGVDEVGRGCLFGPVVAAAVILPTAAVATLSAAGVTDSKKLSAVQRTALAKLIRSLTSDCAIGVASVREIDRINILQASLLAMRRAVLRLPSPPDLCWVDGNQKIPGLLMPQQTWVKGDQRSLEIAAASILAKVWRDELLTRLALKYPQYDLATNKGYGTPAHCRALQQFGITRWHRTSFSPCRGLTQPAAASLQAIGLLDDKPAGAIGTDGAEHAQA